MRRPASVFPLNKERVRTETGAKLLIFTQIQFVFLEK
jgi:hypothetical protein